MVGIVSYGAYIPIFRLARSEIASTWLGAGMAGEKAVANFDEDSLTMAVEATLDCLNGQDRSNIDGLYLATTTSPYQEKLAASILAAAADLKPDLRAADIGGSLRSATMALRAALDAVQAGSARRFLVAAADSRLPAPNSENEMQWGDGGAAFIVGDSEVAVSVEGSYTLTSDFMDVWRREGDRYHRTWEDRFIQTHGYNAILPEAVRGLMKKYGASPKDFAKAIFPAPTARLHAGIARQLGLDAKAQVQDPMFATVGYTGSAMAPMMLVAALEQAKPGDRLLFVNYGDGCDAFILQVQPQIQQVRERRGIARHLASKMMVPNYGRYLRFRDLMEWSPDRYVELEGSATVSWRDRNVILSLHAARCNQCQQLHFPIQRVCPYCQAKDDYQEVGISDRKGAIFTFSIDERIWTKDPPNVACVVDLEGGGRYYGLMTDRDPAKLKVEMPVELTLRRMHEGAGFHNYFWKIRPVRC